MDRTDPPCVFLGSPAVLTLDQRVRLDAWLDWLQMQALKVVRLERSGYGPKPWEQLTDLLAHGEGAVLLGFRQLQARGAVWRPGTSEQGSAADWWTTPWLHLEAGMALAMRIPLLVVPDDGVHEGIFNPELWSGDVHGSTPEPPGSDRWLAQVRDRRAARGAP